VAAILAENFSEMGLSLTPGIAEALLTGILTDSQGFRTLNTNPAADPYPDLTILHVRRTLTDQMGPQTYNYAVTRANSRWYATGDVHRLSRARWDRLVEWLLAGDGEILRTYLPPADPTNDEEPELTDTKQEADRQADLAREQADPNPHKVGSILWHQEEQRRQIAHAERRGGKA
jgi:hypothetical protein